MPDYVNAVSWEADQILTMFLNLNRRVSRYFSDVQNLTNLDAVRRSLYDLQGALANMYQLSVAYRYKAGEDAGSLIGKDGPVGHVLTYDMIAQFNGPPPANLTLDAAKELAKDALEHLLPDYRADIHRL